MVPFKSGISDPFRHLKGGFFGITNSSSSWKNGNVIQGEVSGGPRILKPFGIVKNIVYITKKGWMWEWSKVWFNSSWMSYDFSKPVSFKSIRSSSLNINLHFHTPFSKTLVWLHLVTLSQWSCFSSSFVSSMSTSSCGQALRASFPGGNFIMRGRSNKWGGKKTPRTFAWPFFCYRFFFFLIVLQGIVITVTNIIDLVLQTIFCMTSLPNSITSNIISRGRRQQSRRRQRCSRRQRQKQVPRAGLGEEDFFCYIKPYRFGYRSVIVFPTFFCMLKLRCSVTRRG